MTNRDRKREIDREGERERDRDIEKERERETCKLCKNPTSVLVVLYLTVVKVRGTRYIAPAHDRWSRPRSLCAFISTLKEAIIHRHRGGNCWKYLLARCFIVPQAIIPLFY